ncbi:glycosyltransferase [Actinorhabdospora filicis]|nr:glycosyltransferase [Actinorhabdospora filicis]
MRVLLSTIGSRGEVQPVTGLAVALRERGADVRIVAPPDFRELVEDLGFAMVPIGPTLRRPPGTGDWAAGMTPEKARKLTEDTVREQFAVVGEAARDRDVVVAAGSLQIAARSVAEKLGVPYIFAAYCAISLPSPLHAPPRMPWQRPGDGIEEMWAQEAVQWNALFGPLLNRHRAELGLAPVGDVREHVHTSSPWLAADPVLGPWPEPDDEGVFTTGAWLLADERPLPGEVEAFLRAGGPPVYFGFGSMTAPPELGAAMVEAARRDGARAIVQRGWAGLDTGAAGPDVLAVGEVNQRALFPRVAAVVHHGGAGTTTTAALAGVPQVVVPQRFDQFYWAARVERLGIGVAHPPQAPDAASLAGALAALTAVTGANARRVARDVVTDGADIAAGRISRTVEDRI